MLVLLWQKLHQINQVGPIVTKAPSDLSSWSFCDKSSIRLIQLVLLWQKLRQINQVGPIVTKAPSD